MALARRHRARPVEPSKRGARRDDGPAFVEGGRYVSVRWSGGAYPLAKRRLAVKLRRDADPLTPLRALPGAHRSFMLR